MKIWLKTLRAEKKISRAEFRQRSMIGEVHFCELEQGCVKDFSPETRQLNRSNIEGCVKDFSPETRQLISFRQTDRK